MPAAKSKKRQFLKLMNSYSKKRQFFEKINASVQLQQPCEFDDALDLCREKSSRLWKMFLKKEFGKVQHQQKFDHD